MDMPTFDELKDLARRDPEAFETLRAELIEDCIRSSSRRNQRRLKGLQFVIEAKRLVADNPMKALLEIQAMMYDSVLSLQQALRMQPPATEALTPGPRRSGQVLCPFPQLSRDVGCQGRHREHSRPEVTALEGIGLEQLGPRLALPKPKRKLKNQGEG